MKLIIIVALLREAIIKREGVLGPFFMLQCTGVRARGKDSSLERYVSTYHTSP